jgi:hypothetical protein
VASWTVFEQQSVRISARVTAFTFVCAACARDTATLGFGAATVHAALPLERTRGSVTCARGHRIDVERAEH